MKSLSTKINYSEWLLLWQFEANYSGINLSTDTETVEPCTITEWPCSFYEIVRCNFSYCIASLLLMFIFLQS
jgi:hypothetical protein